MGLIAIEGMEFHAFHGLLEEEQKIGGRFAVDILIETNFSEAARADDIRGTVNYQEIYNLVKKEMALPSKLIEHVAQRILKTILDKIQDIDQLEVKVIKYRPPVNGVIEKVSVVLKS